MMALDFSTVDQAVDVMAVDKAADQAVEDLMVDQAVDKAVKMCIHGLQLVSGVAWGILAVASHCMHFTALILLTTLHSTSRTRHLRTFCDRVRAMESGKFPPSRRELLGRAYDDRADSKR